MNKGWLFIIGVLVLLIPLSAAGQSLQLADSLFAKGKRFDDIRRWGWLDDQEKMQQLIENDPGFEGYVDGREYLPIPHSELDPRCTTPTGRQNVVRPAASEPPRGQSEPAVTHAPAPASQDCRKQHYHVIPT